MSRRRVYFWLATPSPHLAAFMRSLADLPGIERVQAVFTRPLEKERLAMGWGDACFGAVETHFCPDGAQLSKLLEESDGEAVHVFAQFITDSVIRQLFRRVAGRPATVGLMSEGRDWRGLKGALRTLHSFARERRMARRCDFLLAIGHQSRTWHRRAGFRPERIFDFCYVVENPPPAAAGPPAHAGPARLLFVGQLNRGKRVDLLLQAAADLAATEWELQIVGDGPEREALADMGRQLGIAAKVRFLGVKNNAEARRAMAAADLLVLPSHWDGWGAVVSEALMGGARVVCSDFCGAAGLVRGTAYGGVFACDSAAALAAALAGQIARGPVLAEERAAIRAYGGRVSGAAVAAYFVDILDFIQHGGKPAPAPPWKAHAGGSA